MGILDFFSGMGTEIKVKSKLKELLSKCKNSTDCGVLEVEFDNFILNFDEKELSKERKASMIEDAKSEFSRKYYELEITE